MNENSSMPSPPAVPPVATTPLAPSDVDFMPPLLRSISTLLRLRGKIVSSQFLLAGLAGTAHITPSACLLSAKRAGMSGKIMPKQHLSDISPLTLPCILLLKNNSSCVVTKITKDEAEIITPEADDITQTVPLEELASNYSGYVLFGALESRLDNRAEELKLSHGKTWFWDVIKHYGPIYRHVALASVVINLIAVATPLFVMNVYDRVVPNNAMETLWVLAGGIFIAYLFDFLLRTLRNYFVDLAGRNADVVLSSKLVDKVLSMRLDARPESTGALVNNLREFESVREFFSSSTLLACMDLPFLVVFMTLLFFIGGPIVVIPLLAIPILIGVGLFLKQMSKSVAERGYRQSMQKNALLVEIVNGLETLKCCLAEKRMQRLWEAVVGQSADQTIISRKYTNLAITISVLTIQMVTVATVIWGVYRIKSGEMTMGGLIACNILIGRGMAPMMQIASLLTRFQNSRVALKALDLLMELPSENQDEKALADFSTLKPSFKLENITFSYPGAASPTLYDINLTIRPGDRVGIIGRMGSGKSTLGKLLIGLYQPSQGTVKYGDVDIRQLSSADLRGKIGFLPQDVVLFYGTLRDNIALGDPAITDHLILRAATLAGVSNFVKSMPAGFATQVGEQGKSLSGGQRQAVALARALLRDPEVLILDEPTSNMDDATERMIQRRLNEILPNKTLIVITHRPSMLQIVNRILVMDNGRIVMDGPRDEVIRRLREQSTASSTRKGIQHDQQERA